MQSSEAGGHGASPASLVSFIPELVDHAQALCQKLDIQPAVPVVAAGGITDARQVGSNALHDHGVFLLMCSAVYIADTGCLHCMADPSL